MKTDSGDPHIDPWLDEMRRSLFGAPAPRKADDLPDEEKPKAYRRPITLATRVTFLEGL